MGIFIVEGLWTLRIENLKLIPKYMKKIVVESITNEVRKLYPLNDISWHRQEVSVIDSSAVSPLM